MTPDQIISSRDQLLSEGFTPASVAVRVHDQLLSVMRELEVLTQTNERNVEGAWQSMEELKAECERRGHDIERLQTTNTELATENERLRKAAVLAVAPLEAMRMSGMTKHLGPETRAGIDEGIAAVREAVRVK